MIYDKRKLKRYDIFLIVEFKPLRSPGGFSIGITRDLSPDGFSLEAQTIECQSGDIMEFRLKHPDADWATDVSGEVIWRNHSWYKYVIGIKFLKVNEEQNAKILKLMSAVRDTETRPEQTGKVSEGLLKTEKEKMPVADMSAVTTNNSIPDIHVTKTSPVLLKGTEHCELTGSERTFIAGDVFGSNRDNGKEDLSIPEDTDNPEKRFTEILPREPVTVPESIDNKVVEGTAHTDKIKEADLVDEKTHKAHIDAGYAWDTTQAVYDIDKIKINRKKKLWLYVPAAMVFIIILAVALPVMIKKLNHPSIPAVTESADYNNTSKDEVVPVSDNIQMSSRALDEPSVPSQVMNIRANNALAPDQDKAVNLRPASAQKDPAGILPPKSDIATEVKSKKSANAALPAEMETAIKNTPQMNNAILKPEAVTGIKPEPGNVGNSNKVDLLAKIDETLKDLRAMQNEKPKETEAVIETKKTPEDKLPAKTEEQPVTSQVVKLEEMPAAAAAVTETKVTPVVEQEVKTREGKKEGEKRTGPAVKTGGMPNVVLLVKRDKSGNSQSNPSDTKGVSTADLLNKWKHIGSTKSGVPLFIASDNISQPYGDVVNVMVKASVNKKDFIDLLAINCSQIKLRILEERNGNNPVFSSYSSEWKDIIPDSMILYNSACPVKK